MAYQKVDPTAFQYQYEESRRRPTGGGGFDSWKMKAAPLGKPPLRNIIRGLPPHPNMVVTLPDGREGVDPIIGTKIHFNLGPNGDTASPCLEPYGERCPACDWVDELFRRAKQEGDPDRVKQLRDLAFKQRAKFRFFMNIVDLARPEAGVQKWAFGPELEQRVRGCFMSDDQPPQFRDITDPETGRDIILDVGTKPGRNSGETFPDYETIKAKDTPSPLMDMAWLDGIHDLTLEIFKPSAEQVQGALQGRKVTRTQPTLPQATMAPPPALSSPAQPRPVQLPTPTAAPSAPAPTPQPVPPPAPARGRGKASAPAPPLVPPPAPAVQRQAFGAPAPTPAGNGGDPLAQAKAEVLRLGASVGFSTPHDVTMEEVISWGKPVISCYGRETDPTLPVCQGCPAIIACQAIKMGLMAAP